MDIQFSKFAKITLVLVYLVVVAGSVVRMTGSGMGCPDWPKCFGYLIPPTEEETLQWSEMREFKSGQVIIHNDQLYSAIGNFTTGNEFESKNWKLYTKHSYAKFNPAHTWTEFINRLFGAVAGLATFILMLMSFRFWKKRKLYTLLGIFVLLGMGFEAWLGATVVYSVLAPVKISIHMLMALVIIAMLIYLVQSTQSQKNLSVGDKKIRNLFVIAISLTLLQILMGTQVREFVDTQIKSIGEYDKSLWLNQPNLLFYIHRSFSIITLLLNGYLWYICKKQSLGYAKTTAVFALVLGSAISGIAMYYADFPILSQPLHLVMASILFGLQFYLILESQTALTNKKRL